MIDLAFEARSIEARAHCAVPTLAITLAIESARPVAALSLQVQVQIEAGRRGYSDREAERLWPLFGDRSQWARSSRSLRWAQLSLQVPAFNEACEVSLDLPCNFDVSLPEFRYLLAVEDGSFPLRLFFRGQVFFRDDSGALQVQPVPWDREASLALPTAVWEELQAMYRPGLEALHLSRELLERLTEQQRAGAFTGLEECLAALLDAARPAPPWEAARGLARAVLREGYMLYPYRPSALKNQQRWAFGAVYPPAWCKATAEGDPHQLSARLPIEAPPTARLSLRLNFLQLGASEDGSTPWQRGVERCVELGPLALSALLRRAQRRPFRFAIGEAVLEGAVELSAELLDDERAALRVSVLNTSAWGLEGRPSRAQALERSAASCQFLLYLDQGAFLSVQDPPSELEFAAESGGLWPVLIGEARGPSRSSMALCAPMILSDFPAIAPQSPGDFFDGTEIDEMLSLRVLTLTEEEKAAVRAADPAGRALIERTEALGPEGLAALHGAVRAEDKSGFAPGRKVRLRPRRGGDVFDLVLAGRSATIAAVERDLEDRVYLAVTIDDDPGRDLGMEGKPGHRFFYRPEEVEVLD